MSDYYIKNHNKYFTYSRLPTNIFDFMKPIVKDLVLKWLIDDMECFLKFISLYGFFLDSFYCGNVPKIINKKIDSIIDNTIDIFLEMYIVKFYSRFFSIKLRQFILLHSYHFKKTYINEIILKSYQDKFFSKNEIIINYNQNFSTFIKNFYDCIKHQEIEQKEKEDKIKRDRLEYLRNKKNKRLIKNRILVRKR